jgi:hypothetical protein
MNGPQTRLMTPADRCHGGGWLTALEAGTGKVWRTNLAGEMRQ